MESVNERLSGVVIKMFCAGIAREYWSYRQHFAVSSDFSFLFEVLLLPFVHH